MNTKSGICTRCRKSLIRVNDKAEIELIYCMKCAKAAETLNIMDYDLGFEEFYSMVSAGTISDE